MPGVGCDFVVKDIRARPDSFETFPSAEPGRLRPMDNAMMFLVLFEVTTGRAVLGGNRTFW